MLHIGEHDNHVGNCFRHELHHHVDVLILLRHEVHVSFFLADKRLGYVEAAVGNAFYFGDDVEHRRDAEFTFVAQAAIYHTVEVFGYFYLHAVAYLFILAHAAVELVEFHCAELGVNEFHHHVVHPLNALCIHHDFALCLHNVKFRGVEQTR